MKLRKIRAGVIGFLIVGAAGTLLHFVYEWTGEKSVAALFSAVNESIWEHMKLLFVPLFLLALIQSVYAEKRQPLFWCAKLCGTLVGLLVIPMVYYTYTGALGVSADWFNITIFFIADAAAFATEGVCLRRGGGRVPPLFALSVLCGIAIVFVVFTFVPPIIPLFCDPRTGLYGMA